MRGVELICGCCEQLINSKQLMIITAIFDTLIEWLGRQPKARTSELVATKFTF